MTEIGESVGLPFARQHERSSEHCPFCPEEKPPEPWTTYAGAKNHSGVLRDLLVEPETLGHRQPNARPKDGAKQRQRADRRAPQPTFKTRAHGEYSFEAHHLVSGKQALKRVRAMEQWIKKGAKIDADTGYSVNNARNGVWLPSVPVSLQGGGFGRLTDAEKFTIAGAVMADGHGQFHRGPHNVQPGEDLEEKHHDSYDAWLRESLKVIADRIHDWSFRCALCATKRDADAKLHPSVRVNEALDRLSDIVRTKVTGGPARWDLFVSKLAYWYHRQEVHDRRAKFDRRGRYAPTTM